MAFTNFSNCRTVTSARMSPALCARSSSAVAVANTAPRHHDTSVSVTSIAVMSDAATPRSVLPWATTALSHTTSPSPGDGALSNPSPRWHNASMWSR